MQKFHCLTSEVSVWFKFNFVGQAEDALCHQDICFAARLLIGSTDLTGERHPARCHSHADAVVGNGEIPVERIQDGPSYLIVATRLPFTVQIVQGFVAEFRRIATCMEGNAEKPLFEIMLHLSSLPALVFTMHQTSQRTRGPRVPCTSLFFKALARCTVANGTNPPTPRL